MRVFIESIIRHLILYLAHLLCSLLLTDHILFTFTISSVTQTSTILRFSPGCGRSQCLCGAAGPACFSWCCWLFPGWSPPAPSLGYHLRSHPPPRPRDPPPGRGRTTTASHGAGRPAPPPPRSTGSLLPVHGVTPGDEYISVFMFLLSSYFHLLECNTFLLFMFFKNSHSHLPVSESCCYSESWRIRQDLSAISLQSHR